MKKYRNPANGDEGKGPEPIMDKETFVNRVLWTVDTEIAKRLDGRPEDERHLGYFDALGLSNVVKGLFLNSTGDLPYEVEVACEIGEAMMAPSEAERRKHLKAAVGIGGGTAGIAMIITGVGAALGWGAGVIATVVAFFAGVPMAGPVAWILAGSAVAAIAVYFAATSDQERNTERYIKAFKAALTEAVDCCWDRISDDFSEAA